MKIYLFLALLAITAQASAKTVICASKTRELIVILANNATSENIDGKALILLSGYDETKYEEARYNNQLPDFVYEYIDANRDPRKVDAMSPTSDAHSFGLHASAKDSWRGKERMSLGYNSDNKTMKVKMEDGETLVSAIPGIYNEYENFTLKNCVESSETMSDHADAIQIENPEVTTEMWSTAVGCASTNLEASDDCYDRGMDNYFKSNPITPKTQALNALSNVTKKLMHNLGTGK